MKGLKGGRGGSLVGSGGSFGEGWGGGREGGESWGEGGRVMSDDCHACDPVTTLLCDIILTRQCPIGCDRL